VAPAPAPPPPPTHPTRHPPGGAAAGPPPTGEEAGGRDGRRDRAHPDARDAPAARRRGVEPAQLGREGGEEEVGGGREHVGRILC